MKKTVTIEAFANVYETGVSFGTVNNGKYGVFLHMTENDAKKIRNNDVLAESIPCKITFELDVPEKKVEVTEGKVRNLYADYLAEDEGKNSFDEYLIDKLFGGE